MHDFLIGFTFVLLVIAPSFAALNPFRKNRF